MRVLAEDDLHPRLPREFEQLGDPRERRLGVRDDQGAAILDEVVLHVDYEQRGARGIGRHPLVHLVVRNPDCARHLWIILLLLFRV